QAGHAARDHHRRHERRRSRDHQWTERGRDDRPLRYRAVPARRKGVATMNQENQRMREMKNIRKIYRTESIETHALEDLSLSVAAGEFISVTGPSGSGKTTFLNVAGLLDTFDGGSYI